MLRSSNYRSLLAPVLCFWVFSSVPRLWFHFLEGSLADETPIALATILAGFFSDGAFAACLFLPLQVFGPLLRRFPPKAILILQRALVVVFALAILVAMVNVEYVRYFGGNANVTHFSFVSSSEALLPSLREIFPFWKLAIDILVVPGLFIVACRYVPWWRFDLAVKGWGGAAAACVILAVGLLTPRFWPVTEPVWKSLSDNYLIAFTKYFVFGDEFRAKAETPIQTVFEPLPLPPSDETPQPWLFIDPRFPLAKANHHHMCALRMWNEEQCAVDNDRDGAPLETDCNDWDARIRPGAADRPGNGVDEDCSGIDANPPNIIFIHWEGARAVDVGSIGYHTRSTPQFDRHAEDGLLFRNAYANGTQTRWSLTSVYNSILPRLSTRWIFKHNPDLNIQAWPQILKNFGYQTIYMHSANVSFGSFQTRFWEWFDVILDRRRSKELRGMKKIGWGVPDKEFYRYVYKYLTHRKDKRPFMLTAATVSLHHPFRLPEKKYEMESHSRRGNQVPNLMRYVDAALGDFLDKILEDPRFDNTIIIVAADHGLNWYSPHSTHTHSTLWEDLVWVPMLLLGDWGVKPGTIDEVRQLADIGPTVLDRLGIEIPNHFIGQSLLRRFGNREAKAFFGNADSGAAAGIRIGDDKYFHNFSSDYSRFFDMKNDRREKKNLAGTKAVAERQARYHAMLVGVYANNARLIKENRIWNWRWSLDGRKKRR